jgi:hypothetical protein
MPPSRPHTPVSPRRGADVQRKSSAWSFAQSATVRAVGIGGTERPGHGLDLFAVADQHGFQRRATLNTGGGGEDRAELCAEQASKGNVSAWRFGFRLVGPGVEQFAQGRTDGPNRG